MCDDIVNMGGGKGGADFDPKGKSDGEIRKFWLETAELPNGFERRSK